jgi:hypothetical protein
VERSGERSKREIEASLLSTLNCTRSVVYCTLRDMRAEPPPSSAQRPPQVATKSLWTLPYSLLSMSFRATAVYVVLYRGTRSTLPKALTPHRPEQGPALPDRRRALVPWYCTVRCSARSIRKDSEEQASKHGPELRRQGQLPLCRQMASGRDTH